MSTTDSAAPEMRPARAMRADARRNYERLLVAANAAFTEHGPDASLDDIARRAGVGIGTLYRHFPTRQALLEAVYRDQIEALSVEAESLLNAPSPGDALATWLRSVLTHNVTQRGLKEALMNGEGSELVSSSKMQMREAGGALLARAQQAGAIRSDLDIADLLRLVYGIALANEKAPESAMRADRCLLVMIDGLRHQEAPEPAAE
jgi:AcrR family transcriptional regulator